MKVRVVKSSWSSLRCDALFVPIFEEDLKEDTFISGIDEALGGLLTELKETGELTGRQGDIATVYRPTGLECRRLVLVGSGQQSLYDSASIRSILMRAVIKTNAQMFRTLAVFRRSSEDPLLAAQAAVEGLILGSWNSAEYKTVSRPIQQLEEILLAFDGNGVEEFSTEHLERRAEALGSATNLARSLANEPGNMVSPSRLADRAKEIAERTGLEIEIWDEQRIEKEGMNAVLAVARGSDEPARFVILRHHGAASTDEPAAVLVGKGVTFDSGGISIKPSQHMEEMKSDKAGACAVLAAMQAIAQLQVPRNVVGIIAAAENLPSGRAQRPGDIIRSCSGKTIEVINTDAEGRLLLADALHYATMMKPAFIIDIATLTGACVVALGKIRAGFFSNHDSLASALTRAARRAGELVWPLPLDAEYARDLKSEIADIRNVGERWGGAVSAAKFLEEFVEGVPWCHIDMAGVARFRDEDVAKGATGFGVRTLTELVSDPALYRLS